MKTAFSFFAFVAALSASMSAPAQNYPDKPIRMILGYAVGSSVDIGGRIVASELSLRLRQPVIVENRIGANAFIAADAVMKAPPDGYTISFGSVMNFHPIFVKTAALDASKELLPVSNSMTGTYVLYSSAKLPASSFQEFVKYAKSVPSGKLNFASAGAGTDMVVEVLKTNSGISYTNIPYKGSAPQITLALIGGEADYTFGVVPGWPPHVQAGTVRALMFAGTKRHPLLPNAPTARELGMPIFEASAFNYGVWVARGVPKAIVDRLSAESAAAATTPAATEQIRRAGLEPVGSTAEEQLRTFQTEVKFWEDAARLVNFQPQ